MSDQPVRQYGYVGVLDKGLRLLNAFSVTDVWLGSTELAARADLSKPTASRLAKTLAASGYLLYSQQRRKYRLGISVLALGYAARIESGITQVAQPFLQKLADDFGTHASLAIRDHTDVVHLEVCHSSNTLMTLRLEVGSRIPLAGTATGHALLAAVSNHERSQLMPKLARRHRKHWVSIQRRMERGIAQVKSSGYTTSEKGWQTDINGVAAPLMVPGAPPLALACGAPARHLPRKKMDVIGQRLVRTAKEIKQRLTATGAELDVEIKT